MELNCGWNAPCGIGRELWLKCNWNGLDKWPHVPGWRQSGWSDLVFSALVGNRLGRIGMTVIEGWTLSQSWVGVQLDGVNVATVEANCNQLKVYCVWRELNIE